MNLIPNFIRRRISHRQGLVKILDNILWLFLDKGLRLLVGMLVSIWMARYLGPEQFGQFNYAIAFVSLFGAIAVLGLKDIVVRDLVLKPESLSTTLGTASFLRLCGGFIAMILIIVSITWIRPDDSLTKTMIVILSISLIFKSSEVIKYWFEALVESKYVVWVENSIFLCIAVVQITLILSQAPLIAFIWAVLVEAVLVALGLVVLYHNREKSIRTWEIKFVRAKSLMKDSWPLMLSGITVMIYMRIDQIMLGEMVGSESVGIYSAALKISEIWYVIPMIIVASLFPKIIESKKRENALYRSRMQRLLDMMVVLSLVIAITFTFLSDWIILLLFGDRFSGSISVFQVHIWTNIFVFLGVASSKWFLVEELQTLLFLRTAMGALLNIILNLILIPYYGALGAAIASLIAQIFAAYIFDAIHNKTRNLFYLKSLSLMIIPRVLARRSL